MRILVFDTETTGLPQTKIISPDTLDQWPYIVQFSYVVYDSSLNVLVKQSDNIIRLPAHITIPEEATQIHHITTHMSATQGIPLTEVLDEFFYYARCTDKIVGHNIAFDINVLKVELCRMICNPGETLTNKQKSKYDLHFVSNFDGFCCTMNESVELCNLQAVNRRGESYVKFPKLAELHQKLFHHVPSGLHNSFNDILITLRCYIKLYEDKDLCRTCHSFKKAANQLDLI